MRDRSNLRFSAGALYLGLSVLPILINPAISSSFDEIYLHPKVLWIYAVILPSSLLFIYRGWNALYNQRPNSLHFSLIIWVSWLLLSSLLIHRDWRGWWGAIDRADGTVMHMIYSVILLTGLAWANNQDNARRIFEKAALLSSTFLSLTNILQQLSLMGIPGEGAISGVSATLFGGTLGNRGYMGGALALLLPVAVALVQRSQSWLWTCSAVVLMSWAWAGSFTRGAWLAGVLGLIWLAVWLQKQVPKRAWSAVALGIVLCVMTAEIQGVGRSFSQYGMTPAAAPLQSFTDSSGRGVLWKSAVYGIQQRPLLGWGTPALWRAMNARPERELLAESGALDIAQIQRLNTQDDQAPNFLITHPNGQREKIVLSINKVHNEYLDYALTYGIPAALMFTFLLGWSIWSGRTFAPGVSAGLVAYAAYLMTWPEIIRFAPIAWFMMGIALAGHVMQRSKVQP